MIWFDHVPDGQQIAHAAGTGFDPHVDKVISRITVAGKLMGGFIFTNYSKVAMQVHCAGFMPRWLTPELLALVFDYPFNQLKVEQLIVTAPSTNAPNVKMYVRAGYTPITMIPRAVVGGDLLILSMTRDECKWLRYGGRYIRRSAGRRELAA